jgi:hypothetical protein
MREARQVGDHNFIAECNNWANIPEILGISDACALIRTTGFD